MKNCFLIALLVLWFFGNLQGQPMLPEHTYNGRNISRFPMKSGQMKYVVTDSLYNIKLYHNNHAYWKTLHLAIPANVSGFVLENISDQTINTDTLVEAIISYTIGSVTNAKVVNENGLVLLDTNSATFTLSQIPGAPNKLICSDLGGKNHKVYALPLSTTRAETVFRNVKGLNRSSLSQAGVKWYCFDSTSCSAKLYDPNYSLWKSIPMPGANNNQFVSFLEVSDDFFNPNSSPEVAYICRNILSFQNEINIVDENGTLQLNIPNYYSSAHVTNPGSPDKLLITQGLNSPNLFSVVYSLPAFAVEATFYHQTQVLNLKNGGLVYACPNVADNRVQLFRADYSAWKWVNAPVPATAQSWSMLYANDSVFNPDPEMEFWVYYFDGHKYFYSIGSESGITYLSTSGSTGTSFMYPYLYPPSDGKVFLIENYSAISNLKVYKLPFNPVTGNMVIEKPDEMGYVYNLPGTRKVVFVQNESENGQGNIIVLDSKGSVVPFKSQKTNAGLEISVAVNGCYLMRAINPNGTYKTYRFVIE